MAVTKVGPRTPLSSCQQSTWHKHHSVSLRCHQDFIQYWFEQWFAQKTIRWKNWYCLTDRCWAKIAQHTWSSGLCGIVGCSACKPCQTTSKSSHSCSTLRQPQSPSSSWGPCRCYRCTGCPRWAPGKWLKACFSKKSPCAPHCPSQSPGRRGSLTVWKSLWCNRNSCTQILCDHSACLRNGIPTAFIQFYSKLRWSSSFGQSLWYYRRGHMWRSTFGQIALKCPGSSSLPGTPPHAGFGSPDPVLLFPRSWV